MLLSILFINYYNLIIAYQERWRERPYETQQPAFFASVLNPAVFIPKDEFLE